MQYKKSYLIANVLLILGLSSCVPKTTEKQLGRYQSVANEQEVVGVDVRTDWEKSWSPAPGSESFSFFNVDKIAKTYGKDQHLFIFCEAGVRADYVVKKLKAKGFRNVTNIRDWRTWNALETDKSSF